MCPRVDLSSRLSRRAALLAQRAGRPAARGIVAAMGVTLRSYVDAVLLQVPHKGRAIWDRMNRPARTGAPAAVSNKRLLPSDPYSMSHTERGPDMRAFISTSAAVGRRSMSR